MRTSRPVAEKLGTVRQDPDLNGLLFILIIRATGGRQERAARACCHLERKGVKGLVTRFCIFIARHYLFSQELLRARGEIFWSSR